jgi:streptogramin lyase
LRILGRVDEAAGSVSCDITEFTIPTDDWNSYPSGIVVGPDGNLWFTESSSNKIAHTNPAGANTPPVDGSAVAPTPDAAAE